jgi:hypothetical protein
LHSRIEIVCFRLIMSDSSHGCWFFFSQHFWCCCRPPPDKTKDKEGVSLNRTPLNQRSRGPPPPPPPPAEDSEEEGEEEGEEVTTVDLVTMHAAACLSYYDTTELAVPAY